MNNKKLNKIKGNYGEKIACNFLINSGYNILCRNYRNHFGEIDIIAKYKNEIIFIEVKTRTNNNFGEGIEAIDRYKQKHIINTAKFYIFQRHLESYSIRFDAIQIMKDKTHIKTKHIKQIF